MGIIIYITMVVKYSDVFAKTNTQIPAFFMMFWYPNRQRLLLPALPFAILFAAVAFFQENDGLYG